MPQHVIRDIIARKGNAFQRLCFSVSLKEQTAHISVVERDIDEKYGTHIVIHTKSQRLGQLAKDILIALGQKAQYVKWKPTMQDLERRLDETDAFNGLNFWLGDMIRAAVSIQDKKKIAQIKDFYDWLKSNEKWLYEAAKS